MANMEAFLINPMKNRKIKRFKRTRRRAKGVKISRSNLGSLALRTNTWRDDRVGHSRASRKGWRRRIKTKSRHKVHKVHKSNPLGEEVIIMGANPRRRKRSTRKHSRRRFHLFKNAPAKRRRSRRRKYHMARNAPAVNRKRSRRRHRRNPAVGGLSFDIMRPQTLIMPLLTGLVAKMATEKIPAMLNLTTPLTRYGSQAAVAIGGSILLRRFVGRTNAAIWGIVSAVTILTDVVNRYVLKTTLTGLGYDGGYDGGYAGYVGDAGAYPNEVGAFPYEGERMLY